MGKVIARHENIILPEWNRSGAWVRPHLQWLMQPASGSGPGGLGFANITEDDDIFVRKQRLLVRDGDAVHEQFALVVLTAAGWGRVEWARGRLHVGGRGVPLEPGLALRINYAGPTGAIPAIPFGRVLAAARGSTPGPADFAGRIVIIGVTEPGQDLHATPYTASTLARLVTRRPG